jgi:radical SAM superfamily enzyme YgiQ (UPF0313 family)
MAWKSSMGLDTDTPETGEALLDFITRSRIPLLTINLLQALPRTKLWDRLALAGRIVEDDDRESNVEFLLPYAEVVDMWRDCIARAYEPEEVFARFRHQVDVTYINRLNPPRKVDAAMMLFGFGVIARLFVAAGITSHYRRAFWRYAWPLLKSGNIEQLISTGLVAHHLIMFARDAASGKQNASFYSGKLREPEGTPALAA